MVVVIAPIVIVIDRVTGKADTVAAGTLSAKSLRSLVLGLSAVPGIAGSTDGTDNSQRQNSCDCHG